MIRIDRLGRVGIFLVVLLTGGGLFLANRLGGVRRCDFLHPVAEREREGKRLDEELQGALARVESKRQVLAELLDERITFLEAAARFRALDRMPPAFLWDHFRATYPGANDDERHCRELISWLENADDDCIGLAAAARYTSELKRRLKSGPVHLPDIDFVSESR